MIALADAMAGALRLSARVAIARLLAMAAGGEGPAVCAALCEADAIRQAAGMSWAEVVGAGIEARAA